MIRFTGYGVIAENRTSFN